MATPLYLLINDQCHVHWSFQRDDLLKAAKQHPYYCCPDVLDVAIDDALATQLAAFNPPPFTPNVHVKRDRVDPRFFAQAETPAYVDPDGERLYIIFATDGQCYWSPSGNNLNGIARRNPGTHLGEAIRVPLTKTQYVQTFGYFEWCCDNF